MAAAVVPFLLLSCGWQIWKSRGEALADTEVLVTALARVGEEHIAGVIRSFDHVLEELSEIPRHDGRVDPPAFRMLMANRMNSIAEIRSAFFTDATGRVSDATILDAPGMDLHDRGYFQALARDPQRRLVVSEPFLGRAMPVMSIIIARPLRGPDGSFAGIVALGLDPKIFGDELRTVIPVDGGRATLFRTDGIVLARQPDHQNWVGKSIADGEVFKAALTSPSGVLRGVSITNGDDRIIAYRRIGDYPLVIAIGRSTANALLKWRGDSLIVGGATLALALATIVLAGMSDWRLAQRNRVERALMASESRFRMLSDRSPVGIFQTDRTGRVLYVNTRWQDLTGRTATEAAGRKWCVVLHPDDRPAIRDAWDEHIQGGREFLAEMRVIRPDGAIRWVRGHAAAMVGEEGQSAGLVGSLEDITAAKQAEQLLRLSEEKFAKAFMGSPDAMVIATRDEGRYVDVNDAFCRMLGYGRDEFIGHSALELGVWADAAERESAVETLRREERLEDYEFVLRRKDGSLVAVSGSIQQIVLNAEHCLFYIVRDVSERREIEARTRTLLARLDASNKELEQFAYVVSHDLQEPLRMIAGYAQLIDRRYRGKLDGEADEFLGFLVDGAQRMRTMILDLLEYSRVERLGGEFSRFDMAGVLDDVRLNLTGALAEVGGVLEVGAMPTVVADRSQMVRLLQNLIGNALKYRAPERQPVVTVSAESLGDCWRFSVADNGIGIDPQYFERIFLVFQRLHTRDRYPGNGIGLAICKTIVERHGGAMTIDSQADGGSVFHFTLSGALAEGRSHFDF